MAYTTINVATGVFWKKLNNTSSVVYESAIRTEDGALGAIECTFYRDVPYRFLFLNEEMTESVYPSTIYYKTVDSTTPISEYSEERATEQYYSIASSIDTESGYVTFELPMFSNLSGSKIRFSFADFDAATKPLLFSCEANVSEVSPDESSGGIEITVDENSIIGLDMTQEQDFLASEIPYSEFELEILDESDAYNPLLRDGTIDTFQKKQTFSVYLIVKNDSEAWLLDENEIWYITKLGVYMLDEIEREPLAVRLKMIGILQYYGNIYLTENDLMYSNHIQETQVKWYLKYLFGSNISDHALNSFSDDDMIITPFQNESKAEIARIIAERYCSCLYEDENGKIDFHRFGCDAVSADGQNPYCITLDEQIENPVVRREKDLLQSIGITVYKYGKKEDSAKLLDPSQKKVVIETFVKMDGDDGADAEDYIFIGQTNMYTDEGGSTIDLSDPDNNSVEEKLASMERYKFLRYRMRFDTPYKLDSFRLNMYGIGDSYFRYLGIEYNETFEGKTVSIQNAKRIFDMMMFGVNGGMQYCENYIDLWIERDQYIRDMEHILVQDDSFIGIDNREFASSFAFLIVLTFFQITAEPVSEESSKFKIIYSTNTQNTTTGNDTETEIDNPLFTSRREAVTFSRFYKTAYDSTLFTAELGTIGDGTLETGDKILIGIPLYKTGDKTFENYFTAKISKIDLDYTAGLSESISVVMESQKLYQMEYLQSGEYVVEDSPIKDGVYRESYDNVSIKPKDQFRFSMKSQIKL